VTTILPSLTVVEEARIRESVGRPLALQAAEEAFRAMAEGRAVVPPPIGLELPAARGEVHVKGAWMEGAPHFAIKVASGFYDNARHGLPTGSGLVLVFDAATGFPRALLLDNGYLTDLRTGAAGALAVRLLAPDRPLTVAVVGAGTQARFQLRAMADVRTLREIRAWAPHPEGAAELCRELQEELGVPATGAPDVAAAVRGADLVVTVTPARAPLVLDPWVEAHATVIAVGSDGPDKQELDPRLLARADKLIVDHLDQCARLGELHHALAAGALTRDAVHGTLGGVLTGLVAGREAEELIVCDLTGVGVQDAAMARAAWSALEYHRTSATEY
jgi:ornithine cyclodeaminase